MGNHVSEIVESIPPIRWQHVKGSDNPADSASRGLFPAELNGSNQWLEGPYWLKLPESLWPDQPSLLDDHEPHKERRNEEPCLVLTTVEEDSILDRFSNYTRLKRVTAWMFCFVQSCGHRTSTGTPSDALTTEELQSAERCWIRKIQHEEF